MEKVSLIVAIYNVESYLSECLDSLKNQSYQDIEVLCVDDGSTDNSAKIVKDFAKKDKRFKYLFKENGGLSDARNFGLKHVKSKYLMFVDGDDTCHEDMVKNSMEIAIADDLDCVIFGYQQFIEKENISEKISLNLSETKIYQPLKDKDIFAYSNNAAWNKLYKTSIFKDYNLEYPFGYRHQDLGTTFIYLSYCKNIAYLDEALYFYRLDRPNNITQQVDQKIYHIVDMVKYNLDSFKERQLFEQLYEELKYLSFINLFYSFRKLINFNEFKFIAKFIDDVYKLLNDYFPNDKKSIYPLIDYPNAKLYLHPLLLKGYYFIKKLKVKQ